jgi:[acyl-carrier-protein] S-malonyltransferase
MSGFAYVFPGQGSQSVGMLVAKSSEVAATYEEASEALGYDMGELISSGPEEVLNQTEYTQPALLTVSVALFRYAMNNNAEFPDVVLGHSLGEYAALVAAGAIRFEDAVKLVRRRGQYMQGAVPLGKGGMAAVLGLSDDMMIEICESVTRESKTGLVEAANFNAPEQVVVAGDNETLKVLIERCKESGAKRSILLNVSAPFHCSLMKPAALKMEERLSEIEIIAPKIPVVQNVTAVYETDPESIRRNLVDQVCAPVRWTESIKTLWDNQVENFVECGPGRVLSGLIKRVNKRAVVGSLNAEIEANQLASLGK